MVRNDISKRNKYYLNKHRSLELRHFCLQYPGWVRAVRSLDGYRTHSGFIFPGESVQADPTGNTAVSRDKLLRFIAMVDRAATEADVSLQSYILKAVTEGTAYEWLTDVPCSRGTFYETYRRFFWILSRIRENYMLYYE